MSRNGFRQNITFSSVLIKKGDYTMLQNENKVLPLTKMLQVVILAFYGHTIEIDCFHIWLLLPYTTFTTTTAVQQWQN